MRSARRAAESSARVHGSRPERDSGAVVAVLASRQGGRAWTWARSRRGAGSGSSSPSCGGSALSGAAGVSYIGQWDPRVKAILDPLRTFPGADCLRSPDDAMAWLRTAENYPFFAKLCTGAHGTGACFGASFDAEADAIVSANGELIGIRDYATRMFNRCVGGVIFQEVIEQHPQVQSLLAKRVGTARIRAMSLSDRHQVWNLIAR